MIDMTRLPKSEDEILDYGSDYGSDNGGTTEDGKGENGETNEGE